MQNQLSENKSTKKKIFRRVWFWLLISLVIVATLFLIMLPVGIDYGIERYLKAQGADQVSLEDVDFNPITGRMILTNLNVTNGAQTVLKIPEATLKIEWTPFIRKQLVLQRFTISDTELTVEELENGNWRIGGIIIPGKTESTEPSIWDFSFQEATVINSRIELISARLKSDLAIEQAKISKLTSWLHEDSARLEFTGQLNDARTELQMDVSPFGSDVVVSGQIKLKGLSLNPFSQLLQPHLKMLEGRLDANLNIETRQTADSGISHSQKGLLNLSQTRTQIGNTNLSNENLTWDGAVSIDIPKSADGLKLSAEGLLKGSRLAMNDKHASLQIQQENLNWKGKVNYDQTVAALNLNLNGALALQNAKVIESNLDLNEEKLDWKGTLEFSSTEKTDGQSLTADGELIGGRLLANLLDQKLNLEHSGFNWKGRLSIGPVNKADSIKAEGNFTLTGLKAGPVKKDLGLLRAESVNLEEIKFEGFQNINVSKVTLNSLELIAASEAETASSTRKPLFSTQKTTFQNIQLAESKDFSIDVISVSDVNSFLHRNQQGKWSAIEALNSIQKEVFPPDQKDRSPTEQKAAADQAAKTTTNKFGVRIGKLEITGKNIVQIKDESVAPPFRMDLQLSEAHLADLDSRRPEKPASLKLRISDNKKGHLSLDGTMQPFAEQLSLDWAGKIESLELPPLSPYVIQNTGYRFVSGEMQADIPIKINQNQLEGKIDLILYNPTVERVKSEAPPEEKQGKIQISMSLDSALKMLRDDHNNVKLNIPISGDINDPKFSVADAVNKVLAQTLRTSALSYLKFMLGPYGIGLAVAEQAIKGTSKIRLNPILFAPGSTELDEAAIDYLKRVSAILKEHPTVQVDVCGVATESDRAVQKESAASTATDATLLELAKNRTKSIENQLVKLHGIAAKRIIACKPKIDRSAEAKPRVDLKI